MSRLSPSVCRAARALIDWTQEDLARAAGVCRSTVREFEKGHHALQGASEAALVAALDIAGVELLAAGRHGPGVRLRRAPRPASPPAPAQRP
jgi:transcriptional regulator with XRE-family HTH domain